MNARPKLAFVALALAVAACGGPSPSDGGGTPGGSLATPTQLAATPNGLSVTLTWSGPSGVTFDVERAIGQSQSFTLIGSVPKTTFVDTGVSANTTYGYRVRSVSGSNASGWTQAVRVTVTGAAGTPTVPTNLAAAAVSQSEIDVSWTASTSGADGYILMRKTGNASFAPVQKGLITGTTFQDTGLASGTTYAYEVAAMIGSNQSAFSQPVSAATHGQPPPPPAAPTNLAGTAVNDNQVTLTFTDNANDEQGFTVERSQSSSGGFALDLTLSASTGTGTVTTQDYNLSASTTYYYRVQAFNSGGVSAYTQVVSVTTEAPPPAPPAAPTNVVATATSTTSITLTWTAPPGQVTSYAIMRKNSLGGLSTGGTVVDTQFTDTGLPAGSTWAYQVAAINAGGSSPYSAWVTASTPSTPAVPAAPTNLTVVPLSTTSVRFSWTDNADNETSYQVTYAPGRSLPPTPNATLPANSTSYDVTNLTPGQNYIFQVVAVNAGGKSTAPYILYTMPSTTPTTHTIDLVPTYDNEMLASSTDPTLKNKAFPSGELGDGCNWSYAVLAGIQSYVCSTSALYFDVSAVAGKSIVSATLSLYPKLLPADFNSTLRLEAIYQTWNAATISWSTIPQIVVGSQVDQPPPMSYLPVVFDVTNIVQNWASPSGYPNYGFLLENPAVDYAFPDANLLRAVSFYSLEDYAGDPTSRPTLEITYQ